MSERTTADGPRLGKGLPLTRMPAHWMLGRLGKRVMRPGGIGPSEFLLRDLATGRTTTSSSCGPASA